MSERCESLWGGWILLKSEKCQQAVNTKILGKNSTEIKLKYHFKKPVLYSKQNQPRRIVATRFCQ
jgi:hypothetical protein